MTWNEIRSIVCFIGTGMRMVAHRISYHCDNTAVLHGQSVNYVTSVELLCSSILGRQMAFLRADPLGQIYSLLLLVAMRLKLEREEAEVG
jgi:hypothetical protein